MPMVGYLSGRTEDSDASMLDSVRRGLADFGFRSIRIESRFADGRYERLSAELTDLAQRKVNVIISTVFLSGGILQQVRASPIPIVLITGADPIRFGLADSMNRPGGNVTGVNTLSNELSGKQISLLHDLVPKAATVAALFDSKSPSEDISLPDVRDATAKLGQKLLVLEASTAEEIDAQFARLDQEPADAMLLAVSPFFVTRAKQIAALAARHRIPAIYYRREFAEAGGLVSYGHDIADAYRQAGRYAGRILSGEKPGELPIIRPTKFELVINLKAAKVMDLTIPPGVFAIADEVIE
jgi:putative ABC transport system substrate-binding protein